MKHRKNTRPVPPSRGGATAIVTTPLADLIGPNVLVGMTPSDGWAIVTALREAGAEDDLADRLAGALQERSEADELAEVV